MAQRRSTGSRKSKAKPKAKAKTQAKTRIKAKAAAKPAKKAAAKPKAKRKAAKTAPKTAKSLPKAAKANARRPSRAVQGRRSQARKHFEQTTKPGVENRPQGTESAGFIYEDGRQSADESFSPGNYEPGQVGEAKTAPRRRGVANRGGDSETETLPDAGPRAATDGAADPGQRPARPDAD